MVGLNKSDDLQFDENLLEEDVLYDEFLKIAEFSSNELLKMGVKEGDADVFGSQIASLVYSLLNAENVSNHPNLTTALTQRLVELSCDSVRIVRKGLGDLPCQRSIELPDYAPEIYSERLDKSENAVEFLERVWGKHIKANILYQDDIKRLGDDKLVQAVRNYCHHRNMDPSNHLPPPKKERLSRALAEADPESIEGKYFKHRIGIREAQRKAGKQKNRP